MRGTLVLALTGTLIVAALGVRNVTAAPGSRASRGYETCLVKGAPFTLGPSTTTQYKVVPVHVTCAFAEHWVRLLSYEQGAKFSGVLSGGPPGWHCFAGAAGKPASGGSCTDNTGAKSFSWSASFDDAPPPASYLCIGKGAPLNGSAGRAEYKVDVFGVTCAFAKLWVARLTSKRLVLAHKTYSNGTRRDYARIPGGPRGFVCGGSLSSLHQPARSGGCTNLSGTKRFNWVPNQ